MTPRPTRGGGFRRARAAAAALALLTTGSAAAQPDVDPPPAGPFRADGTELFRGLFTVENVAPVGSIHEAEAADPRSLILVLSGRPLAEHRLAVLSEKLCKNGGAVLILAEESANLTRFVPAYGLELLEVTGQRVFCPIPARCLDGNGWMPFPEPFISPRGLGPEAPLVDGLTRIATNVPSHIKLIRRREPGAEPRGLAVFPEGSRAGRPAGPHLHLRRPDPNTGTGTVEDDRLFAVAMAGPREADGKFLVVSDPSVFVNEMLALGVPGGAAGTVDNLTFALRVVRWLKATEAGGRAKCLFVENGVVRGSFADAGFAPRPATLPPPVPVLDPLNPKFQSALVDAGDRAAARVQDAGWFDKVLAGDADSDQRFAGTLRTIAGLLAAAGLGWAVARVRAARHTNDAPGPPRGSGTTTVVGSLAKRQADLIRAGDISGPVREVVAGLFHANGLPAGVTGGPAPRVETTGPAAGEVARQVHAVWDAVMGPAAMPVTPLRWKELEPMLDEVFRAADAGRWRVAPAPTPGRGPA